MESKLIQNTRRNLKKPGDIDTDTSATLDMLFVPLKPICDLEQAGKDAL